MRSAGIRANHHRAGFAGGLGSVALSTLRFASAILLRNFRPGGGSVLGGRGPCFVVGCIIAGVSTALGRVALGRGGEVEG